MFSFMRRRYFKAVRPDGTDFYSGRVDYLTGKTIEHPYVAAGTVNPKSPISPASGAYSYLSVAIAPTECTSLVWPARLLLVTPVGPSSKDTDIVTKVRARRLRVVTELPAWKIFGPNGEQMLRFFAQLEGMRAEADRRMKAGEPPMIPTFEEDAEFASRSGTDVWSIYMKHGRRPTMEAALNYLKNVGANRLFGIKYQNRYGYTYSSSFRDAMRLAAVAILYRDKIHEADYARLTAPWAVIERHSSLTSVL